MALIYGVLHCLSSCTQFALNSVLFLAFPDLFHMLYGETLTEFIYRLLGCHSLEEAIVKY